MVAACGSAAVPPFGRQRGQRRALAALPLGGGHAAFLSLSRPRYRLLPLCAPFLSASAYPCALMLCPNRVRRAACAPTAATPRAWHPPCPWRCARIFACMPSVLAAFRRRATGAPRRGWGPRPQPRPRPGSPDPSAGWLALRAPRRRRAGLRHSGRGVARGGKRCALSSFGLRFRRHAPRRPFLSADALQGDGSRARFRACFRALSRPLASAFAAAFAAAFPRSRLAAFRLSRVSLNFGVPPKYAKTLATRDERGILYAFRYLCRLRRHVHEIKCQLQRLKTKSRCTYGVPPFDLAVARCRSMVGRLRSPHTPLLRCLVLRSGRSRPRGRGLYRAYAVLLCYLLFFVT